VCTEKERELVKDTAIRIRKIRVRELLGHVNDGKFAIPKLQREFVWDGKKAAKLLDSIVSGMPVGVPMIWDTPRNQKLHLREKYHVLPGFNKRHGRVWFIIDGQQRVSVLFHAQEGDELENGRLRPIDFKKVVLFWESLKLANKCSIGGRRTASMSRFVAFLIHTGVDG
jgi:uncharacterized protein with ParB-like and HNH nuclease domain